MLRLQLWVELVAVLVVLACTAVLPVLLLKLRQPAYFCTRAPRRGSAASTFFTPLGRTAL